MRVRDWVMGYADVGRSIYRENIVKLFLYNLDLDKSLNPIDMYLD